MNKRKIIIVIISLLSIIFISIIIMLLLSSLKPPKEKVNKIKTIRYVSTEPIHYKPLNTNIEASGRVISSSDVALVAEAAGRLEKGNVILRKGSNFKKGQIIATIYKDEFELNLQASKSNFLNTISNLLPDLKIDYPDDYETFESFFNNIKTDKPLPELPTITNKKLKIFLSSRMFLSQYYSIIKEQKYLERHILYAPFDGSFTQVNFEIGSYVNPGSAIAKMIQTDKLEIEVPVISNQSIWIKPNSNVKLFSKRHSKNISGKVVRKAKFVDKATQSQSIFIAVNNKDLLLPGEYVKAEFEIEPIKNVMEINRSAVYNFNEVYIVVNNRLAKKTINIVKTNNKTLYFNGIPEGSLLVTQSLINAKSNMLVKTVK